MLARGELRCIGATTLAEYRQHMEKDAAFERRFQQVLVGEPTVQVSLPALTSTGGLLKCITLALRHAHIAHKVHACLPHVAHNLIAAACMLFLPSPLQQSVLQFVAMLCDCDVMLPIIG